MNAEVALGDRGFAFGDGLFETLFVHRGRPVALAEHLTRLRCGLARLGLPEPPFDSVMAAIDAAIGEGAPTGVCKLTVTAGTGPRGYRRPARPEPTIRASFGPLPAAPPSGQAVALSPVPLSGAAALRGLKHLNRLVQVLAQEALPADHGEALMTDGAGRVVSGTMSNLFWCERGRWHTPPLTDGAIAGTRRAWLIEVLGAEVTPCAVGRLALAEAAFLGNAVSAWRPIVRLLGRRLEAGVPPTAALESIEGFWQPDLPAANPWPASLSEAMGNTRWGRVARREGIQETR
ncbi:MULTISPECIES: aminotransferase class IV [unclassified Guyparkeria]|uniref:aminotransferase class IV n=1 Tax=unclassified Guyparkeria TaxID=2626246 RepID=UPI000733913C|nr:MULTISPECIES: aminotransferase class IV [unclassified Guyparkeria]KTG16077.1 hypothetical protein AUR63_04335 [Guyparkeria sp. XI15]OAE84928.1 hypothetical protein AWR35_04345 [Guyparkeria sp. WRN-7]